jgi:hypothetical protein
MPIMRLAHCVVARKDEAENARAELFASNQEHTRMMDEHRRVLAVLTTCAEGSWSVLCVHCARSVMLLAFS